MKNFKFDPEVVWPDETDQNDEQPTPLTPTSSTPVKPVTQDYSNPMALPLYKRLLEDNSFNSTLDE